MAAPHPWHVSLKRFAGLPNENWDQFEGLLRASIAVARIPADHNQQARYLHLHLDGNTKLLSRLARKHETPWMTRSNSYATATQVD